MNADFRPSETATHASGWPDGVFQIKIFPQHYYFTIPGANSFALRARIMVVSGVGIYANQSSKMVADFEALLYHVPIVVVTAVFCL